jgi:hypothetical protein
LKDLLICVLAMTWALGLIWYLGRRRHPYERPDNIDREFREMMRTIRWGADAVLAIDRDDHVGWQTPNDACLDGCNCQIQTVDLASECPDHGPDCSRTQGDGVIVHTSPPSPGRGRGMCPVHGWRCSGGHE